MLIGIEQILFENLVQAVPKLWCILAPNFFRNFVQAEPKL